MRRFSVSQFWDVVRTHDATEILSIASIPALLLTGKPGYTGIVEAGSAFDTDADADARS